MLIIGSAKEVMQSWRLVAQEIEDCVIGMLIDALTGPARLRGQIGGAGVVSDQIRKLLAVPPAVQ